MHVTVDVGDWLASEEIESDGPANAELGLLAVLVNTLQLQSALQPPPSEVLVGLDVARGRVPKQLAYAEPTDPFGTWLSVAAVAEMAGQNSLARLILDELRFKIERAYAANPADMDRCELLSICWSRRGRLSRVAGNHDDAQECYGEAIRLVRNLPWHDARPLAELGLCALAASRGNYPAVVTRAGRVLARRPPVAEVHRVAAHQMMMLAQRKTGKLLDALLHAWAAYDLIPPGDVRGIELLLIMSELATGLGDWEAAEHGFATVLASAVPLRLQVSALIGAIGVYSHRHRHNSNDAHFESFEKNLNMLHVLSQQDLAPRDAVRALLALVDGELIRGNLSLVPERLQEASTLATRFGLYEYQFRVDELLRDLEQRTTSPRLPVTPRPAANAVASAVASPRHEALSRLISVTG